MITCPKCNKDNQDHYKFCLGCGAELPRENAPKPFSPQTPPHGLPVQNSKGAAAPAAQAAPAADPAATLAAEPGPAAAPVAPAVAARASASPAAAAAMVNCPQCAHPNPTGNKFCAACGYNLSAGAGPAAAAPAPAPTAGGPAPAGALKVTLVALRADGSVAGQFELPYEPSVTLGRDTGSIFAGDSYLSPRHATFMRQNGGIVVKDEASLNGVYLKLQPNEPWELHYGDVFRIGQEIIRLEALKPLEPSGDGVERFGSPAEGFIGRLALVIGRDTTGNAFPIPERGVHMGRERGDILFSEDGYVSGLHCRVTKSPDGKLYLTDVGSSNGTFVRLMGEYPLSSSAILLMGQQLFRVDY